MRVAQCQLSTKAICLHVTRRNLTALNEKEKVDLQQPWTDHDPNYPLVGTSIIFTMVFWSHISYLEWEAHWRPIPEKHLASSEAQTFNSFVPINWAILAPAARKIVYKSAHIK